MRLLVSRAGGELSHHRFTDLPRLLEPGDVLVVNTSATLPAALPAHHPQGELRLHLSSPAPEQGGDAWLGELRAGAERHRGGQAGDVLLLPGGATAVLAERRGGERLWLLRLHLPEPLPRYLARHGEPIRYGHSARAWPLESYQTVYANAPGSAEMPSAGRAFTAELVTSLVAAGHRRGPARAAHGRVFARGGRAPAPRVVSAARLQRRAREPRARARRPRDRGGYHGGARARVGSRPRTAAFAPARAGPTW